MKRYSYHLQLLALAWAGVLLVGATACGDGDDPNETPEPPATQPVLIDGKFSSWNSTSADGIFDDGAAIGLFAVEGAFTADAPRYINNARLTLKEGLFRSAASLMLKPSAGTLAAYTPHADRMPLAGRHGCGRPIGRSRLRRCRFHGRDGTRSSRPAGSRADDFSPHVLAHRPFVHDGW